MTEGQNQVSRSFAGGLPVLNQDGGGRVGATRRDVLQWLAASAAAGALEGCARPPVEEIVPYVRAPESIVPGKPLYFATAMPFQSGLGLLVESHMGRPTKVEGNERHPASLGATDVFAQASIYDLYDPDRSQTVLRLGQIATWESCLQALKTALEGQRSGDRGGLRVLTEPVASPTLHHQIRALMQEYPGAKWHQYEPVHRESVRQGSFQAFGEYVNTVYDFGRAGVILSLDADFLAQGAGRVRYAREFAARRRVRQARAPGGDTSYMSRLYVAESAVSNTGVKADYRLAVRPADLPEVARWAAVAVLLEAAESGEAGTFVSDLKSEISDLRSQILNVRSEKHLNRDSRLQNSVARWAISVARDLWQHRGECIVIAGAEQPPAVHALAHLMNHTLGNVGKTIRYTDPIEMEPVSVQESIQQLVADMQAGSVDVLLILGGNPVYSAPADLDFARSLDKVRLRVHLSLHNDETSDLCHWHIPAAHFLEMWSDIRAFDGTVSIIQPLIAPLYEGKSAHELLGALANRPAQSGYDAVRDFWRSKLFSNGERDQGGQSEFERFWRKSLHDGVVSGTKLVDRPVAMQLDAALFQESSPAADQSLEILFRPDAGVYDGSFSNNAWLQEFPRPLTRMTWGNAALMSPATARQLGVENERLVLIGGRGEERVVHAPIWIVPGQADGCIVLNLGYGRKRAGRIGSGVGFNAYLLRTADSPWVAAGLTVEPTMLRESIASTQHHFSMEGRDLVRSGSLEAYLNGSTFEPDHHHAEPGPAMSMFPARESGIHSWGMVIDLSSCTGCGACVVACQAENNIPVVGKAEVARGREMHWLRVDAYQAASSDGGDPVTFFQPVPCMHCENAPCELVCPVAATVHSDEGLNDMVYNRCVGTRYCANNCPYKVRRFNFLSYSDFQTPSLKLMRNPDVTVRSRGVMEKCTYCVQRINQARIDAEKEDRSIRDGEVVTACQAVCPAQAITFGNLADPDSKVSKMRNDPLNYGLLAELNTRPRTTYLAVVKNVAVPVEMDHS